MNSVAKLEEYTIPQLKLPSNSTLSSSNDLTFTDVITNPFFYGSSIIIFIILLSCTITFIFILKSKKKFF